MSVVLLNHEMVAQAAKMLDNLIFLKRRGQLPGVLAAAVSGLETLTPDDTFTLPMFPNLGDDDTQKRQEQTETLAIGMHQMNKSAYLAAYPDEAKNIGEVDYEAWSVYVHEAPSMLHLPFLDDGASNEQADMYRYFSQQVAHIAENLGDTGFADRLRKVLNAVSLAAAHDAFVAHPEYQTAAIATPVIADDLIQLSVHSQLFSVDETGMADAFMPLQASYTQGPAKKLITVGGVNMFSYLLQQKDAEEVKIPVFNDTAEIPFTVPATHEFSAVKYKSAAAVPKPTDFSVLRVVKAIDAVYASFKRKEAKNLLHVNGQAFTDGEKQRLLSNLDASRNMLARQYAQKTLPFLPKTTYQQDKFAYEQSRIRRCAIYLLGDVNALPFRETLDDLVLRTKEFLPELDLSVKKDLAAGVNNSTLSVVIGPRFGIDGVSLQEMFEQPDTDCRDRAVAVLQDLASYAENHDTRLLIQPGVEMPDTLLQELMTHVPGVQATPTTDGAVCYERPASPVLSRPDGQSALMYTLSTTPVEYLERRIFDGAFNVFYDEDVARAVMDNLIAHEPSLRRSLSLAKMPLNEQSRGYLGPHYIKDAKGYLLEKAMHFAVKNNQDTWDILSEEGRAKLIVSECANRGLLSSAEQPIMETVFQNTLTCSDSTTDVVNQISKLRMEFLKVVAPPLPVDPSTGEAIKPDYIDRASGLRRF